MQFMLLRDHAYIRRLTFFWGALTGVYLAAVLYRVLSQQQPPATPTYAGLSAVVAVWFALFDAALPREAFRIGAITSLFASITLNAVLIARAVLAGRAVPVARFVFTLLLLAGLLSTTLHAIRQVNDKDNE